MMPGKYNMVQNEGHFTVLRNGRSGRVRWVTGDGKIVERPLLRLMNPCNRVDMGWYSYVSCCQWMRKADVQRINLPKYKTEQVNGTQAAFFSDYLDELGLLAK